MNFPPAPLLIKARVSTFWFVSFHNWTGIENEFDCIFSAIIRNMSSTGEIDVDVILLLKNPLFLLHQEIPLLFKSHLSSYASDVSYQFFWIHSLRRGRRWGIRCFIAIEAKPFLHHIVSFICA